MANTHCKSCMFSKEANATSPCEFNIIDIIKDNKELSVIDNFFYIKNYRCSYGLSENIYTSYPELQKEQDIKEFVVHQAKLSYYLILDIRTITNEEIHNIIETNIKTLDIKPQFISFICSNEQHSNNVIENIRKTFYGTNIDWKVHMFIDSIPLNDCINIAAETTINNFTKQITTLVIGTIDPNIDMNDHINYLHYLFKILQNGTYCVLKDSTSLHMMGIYISLYKSIVSTIGKDILYGINNISELKIGQYDIEASK